jgi:hypothetical protein
MKSNISFSKTIPGIMEVLLGIFVPIGQIARITMRCAVIGVSLLTLMASPPTEAGDYNLLLNSKFTEGLPIDWKPDAFIPDASLFKWYPDRQAVGISIPAEAQPGNDARWTQVVQVEPGQEYILSGYIKTRDVAPALEPTQCQGPKAGANLSVLENVQPNGDFNFSPPLLGSNDWTFRQVRFKATNSQNASVQKVTIALRVGMYSCLTTGSALFRNVKLQKASN